MVEAKSVIIDNGSGMVKAGLSGEDAPRTVFPAIVGRPKHQSAMQIGDQKECYIGEEADAKRGMLDLNYPISAGIVESWDDMEKVWNHTFYNELRVNPSEVEGVLLTEAPRNPKGNREKMIEIMFESFEVRNAYVAIQAVMSLYAAGRTTGLVVDSGDGVTHTVPVYEGYSIPHAVEKMEIAGRVITTYLQKLLIENLDESLCSSAELEIVKDIKQDLCYVAKDYDAEKEHLNKSSEADKQYKLPDNRVITVPGHVRITAPELLFKPSLNGKSCKAMHQLAWESIGNSDIDIRKDLLKNVILSGGTTMYEGLSDRLKDELITLAPAGSDVKIIAGMDRKFAVWKGASTFASLSTFHDLWITKQDYDEKGAQIVHRKCN